MDVSTTTCPILNVRTKVMSLTKQHTKLLFIHVASSIHTKNSDFQHYSSWIFNSYLPYIIKDICLAKIRKMCHKQKVDNYNFIVIDYKNKYMDNIYLSSIFKYDSVANLFPVDNDKMKTPNVTYIYSPTIRHKITNYKQAVLEGVIPTSCDCMLSKYSKYVDVHHGHVFTGNMDIIDNLPLRSLIKKGLNFREIAAPNKTVLIKSIISGLDSYISKIALKTNKPINSFTKWKSEIISCVYKQLDKLQPYSFNNILSQKSNMDCLNKLHEAFVFTPTDKAGNNVTIVCKRYYLESIHTELSNPIPFKPSNLCQNDIIATHTQFLSSIGLKANSKLPYMYWTSKMHKSPISKRFITSAKGCTLEPLSKMVCTGLSALMNMKKHCTLSYSKRTGINKYYVVDSRDTLIKTLDTMNYQNVPHKSIKTYDFEALYTSIPQDKLKVCMKTFVESVFESKIDKKFISISKNNAWLTMTRSTSVSSFSCTEFISCINYLIDNSFVMFQGKIFKQFVGIPMGISSGPQLANIFLQVYEETHVDSLIKDGKVEEALALSHIFRYQDDCAVLNDKGIFDAAYSTIYPPEMVLKSTNLTQHTTNYLDLNISVFRGKFVYRSYDKRKDYNFAVINYPDLKSNIPIGPAYGVFISQLIRFCRINSKANNFKNDILCLFKKLVNQNFDPNILRFKYKQYCSQNINEWSKYGVEICDYI